MKKILGILLAALMLLTLLPVTALAAETNYGIYINGTQLTSTNIGDFGGTVVYTPASGKSPAKLTLNGADLTNYSPAGGDQEDAPQDLFLPEVSYFDYNIYATEDLEIVLNGENHALTIYTDDNCDLTISGDGTLVVDEWNGTPINLGGNLYINGSASVTAECGGLSHSYGSYPAIWVSGDIVINTRGKVTANALDKGSSVGDAIAAKGDLTIKGGSTVEANSDAGDAIYVEKNLVIEDSASVTAKCNGEHDTIYAGNDIIINTRGTVTADATFEFYRGGQDNPMGKSSAINADGDIDIISGTVNAYASDGCAICALNDLTIKGIANVTAECNGFGVPDGGSYPAIYAKDITISTLGKVYAKAEYNSSGAACAIEANNDINITSGKVIAYADRNDAIWAAKNITISGIASVEAYNDYYTCIWANGNITLNTIGSITAESSGNSALGCKGKMKIDNVGKLLLRGGYNYESTYIGALELYNGNALELADGLTFYGSTTRGAAESNINGKVKAELVSSSDCYTVCLENGSLANALLLKGNDGSRVVNLVKAAGAGVATIAAVRLLTNVAKTVAANAAPWVFATGMIRTLSRLMFPF